MEQFPPSALRQLWLEAETTVGVFAEVAPLRSIGGIVLPRARDRRGGETKGDNLGPVHRVKTSSTTECRLVLPRCKKSDYRPNRFLFNVPRVERWIARPRNRRRRGVPGSGDCPHRRTWLKTQCRPGPEDLSVDPSSYATIERHLKQIIPGEYPDKVAEQCFADAAAFEGAAAGELNAVDDLHSYGSTRCGA